MQGLGLIVIPGGTQLFHAEFLRHERHIHEHRRLFEDLVSLEPIKADGSVKRQISRLVCLYIQGLEIFKCRVLDPELFLRVVALRGLFGDLQPFFRLAVVNSELFTQALPLLAESAFDRIHRFRRKAQVMGRHSYGVEIVGCHAAVFVRTFYKQQMVFVLAGAIVETVGPVSGRLYQYLAAAVEKEAHVSRLPAIAAYGVGNVCRYVYLAAAGIPGLALLKACVGRHPGISRALCRKAFGALDGVVERAIPVLEQAAGCARPHACEHGHHEYLCVPEIAALVSAVSQASCADAGPAVALRRGLDELKDVIAKGSLPLVAAGELDIQVAPNF